MDFCGEERATPQLREVRQVGIVGEQGAKLLPGRLRLDVGEIALGELGAPQRWKLTILIELWHMIICSSAVQRYKKIIKPPKI